MYEQKHILLSRINTNIYTDFKNTLKCWDDLMSNFNFMLSSELISFAQYQQEKTVKYASIHVRINNVNPDRKQMLIYELLYVTWSKTECIL